MTRGQPGSGAANAAGFDGSFITRFGRFFRVPYGGGDCVDFTDQLNSQFTSGLLMLCIAIISLRQFVGKPIQCWVPQEFTSAWEEYSENLCWVSNTYFLLPTEDIPVEEAEMRKVEHICYYQWVGIVMAAQALMSWIPHLIWRFSARRVTLLLQSAKEATVPSPDTRMKAIASLVGALEELAELQSRYRRECKNGVLGRFYWGLPPNCRLTVLFLVVRSLNVGNAFGQLFIMRSFLGVEHWLFGVNLLYELWHGVTWQDTGHFPRVTYCTVNVRMIGQKVAASYTLQCVLPINHFIEKLYIFLWFWYLVTATLTCIATLQWLSCTMFPVRRVNYVVQYLRALKLLNTTDQRECARFVNTCLGWDGVLLVRLVSHMASDLVALDVVTTCWRTYRQAKFTGTEEDLNRLINSLHHQSSSGAAVL